jgi:membrane associated rhomboid family serine protease
VHSGTLHLLFNMLVFVWCGLAVERVLGRTGLIVLYVAGAYAAALAQWGTDAMAVIPMVGASGAVSAVIGAYSLSFGRPKMVTRSVRLNRWINAVWLLAAWVVLQLMMGWLAGTQGLLLATPAHIGGFVAGLLLQRPLLLWRYRKA